MEDLIKSYIQENIEVKQKMLSDKKILSNMATFAQRIVDVYTPNQYNDPTNKLMIDGNGGSASDAQHFAAELVGRYKEERRALPAIAMHTDTSALTAISNDYGYDIAFSRVFEAYALRGDLLVSISTSGNSDNVIKAVNDAKLKGVYTVGLLGKDGGELAKLCDLSIVVPSNNTPRIQEAHIMIIHSVCEIAEKELMKWYKR
jgi:D-sedoheptulose 7-phosphate isomerase